jgi:hypothetical protein
MHGSNVFPLKESLGHLPAPLPQWLIYNHWCTFENGLWTDEDTESTSFHQITINVTIHKLSLYIDLCTFHELLP